MWEKHINERETLKQRNSGKKKGLEIKSLHLSCQTSECKRYNIFTGGWGWGQYCYSKVLLLQSV